MAGRTLDVLRANGEIRRLPWRPRVAPISTVPGARTPSGRRTARSGAVLRPGTGNDAQKARRGRRSRLRGYVSVRR